MKEHAEGKAIEVFRQAMGHRSSRVPVGAIIEACEAYALALKPPAPKDDPAITAAFLRALVADRERLDWLESRDCDVEVGYEFLWTRFDKIPLREAIDAARGATPRGAQEDAE